MYINMVKYPPLGIGYRTTFLDLPRPFSGTGLAQTWKKLIFWTLPSHELPKIFRSNRFFLEKFGPRVSILHCITPYYTVMHNNALESLKCTTNALKNTQIGNNIHHGSGNLVRGTPVQGDGKMLFLSVPGPAPSSGKQARAKFFLEQPSTQETMVTGDLHVKYTKNTLKTHGKHVK